ncbi:MAG: hypothetical protein H0T90_04400 [Gemmatimonadales bacterium]|nr:hypothetical protein [Gemmatimonadales bacterium]
MINFLLALIAGFGGFALARNFVRRRLRFVDAVHSPLAPLLAGVAGALLIWPLALLPMIGTTPVFVCGIGVALGTAKGARALRRMEGEQRRLTP